MSDLPIYAARCTRCNTSFTEEQIAGMTACPSCGSKGVPMDPAMDVTVAVNIHELRVLGIWAENWAAHCDNQHLDDAHREPMRETVAAICSRLEGQLVALGKATPLTLSGEIRQLRQVYPDVEVYRDGKEDVET